MTRTPLRPLARILPSRERGEDPDKIEAENIRQRHADMQDRTRQRASMRLVVLGIFFFGAFGAIGLRMGHLATVEVVEPLTASYGAAIASQRADIVDREGRLLATNFETHSLYAQPHRMVDPEAAATGLAIIFPDLEKERLLKDFTGKRKFLWIKRKISPEQKQLVHDLGDPGLLFGPREMRLYPNGKLAAHILGGASFGEEGVSAAEVVGVAGVEKYFDTYLRDPSNGNAPLQLSLDMTIQDATERVLEGGMRIMSAKGASSVLMDVHTGEVIAAASLPDFDPNDRPRPPTEGHDPSVSPLFNRAVQGVYELGSVYKILTAAQALDLGLAHSNTIIDTSGPMRIGGFPIGEFNNKDYGSISVSEIIVKSSNRGTGRLALQIGSKRQKAFLGSLGLLEETPFEIVEAKGGAPLLPKRWTELTSVTVSYGHGFSTSPLHLATAYAAIANGGYRVKPTIQRQVRPQRGPRVMSEQSAAAARDMLRAVVTSGTASFGDVPGYAVGGKTGTADKPKPRGGYYDDKVIATFATIFPMHDPKYVLVVTLDEPEIHAQGRLRRTAGWTAVPVTAEMIGRIAPLLGLRPQIAPEASTDITLASNN